VHGYADGFEVLVNTCGSPNSNPNLIPPDRHGANIWQRGVEIHNLWFHAQSNKSEQVRLARQHLDAIVKAVDEARLVGTCPDQRWTNDPEAVIQPHLPGTVTTNPMTAFAPHDRNFFIRGNYDSSSSMLRSTAIPANCPDQDGCSTWIRLSDLAEHPGACKLFGDINYQSTHCGRIFQGPLDNGYLVEALQAISLRPRLAQQLFYCWDERRAIYIARLFKHGTWVRVEVDDYVPLGLPSLGSIHKQTPICCTSENFPFVLWPSIIEKAYAKLHTFRASPSQITKDDLGGWESLSGGGCVEEALADLTGGVAGRFRTCETSWDRLFLYLYELQHNTLFVCRPHYQNCFRDNVNLNHYFPYSVHRAVTFEGHVYVQVFCGAHTLYDGGLQDLEIPFALIHADEYPEKSVDGFFWVTARNFAEYFGTIFECRLTHSGDVSVPGMPTLHIPGTLFEHPGVQMNTTSNWCSRCNMVSGHADWSEWLFAHPGVASQDYAPEFTVQIPSDSGECEVVACLEQSDPRMTMCSPVRRQTTAILMNVYEQVKAPDCFSKVIICKSNFIPVRDSVVAFKTLRGCCVKITARFCTAETKVERLVFRCYTSLPVAKVTAGCTVKPYALVEPIGPPLAIRWTLIGSSMPEKSHGLEEPDPYDVESDTMRVPEEDLIKAFQDDIGQCSVA